MISPVAYNEDSLTITIPTLNAAATHRLLMKALTIAMRDRKNLDPDSRDVLADFMIAILPNEHQLVKAYE